MVRELNYHLEPIDAEGDKIRATIVSRAIELLEREKLVILEYSDDSLVDFALEWKDLCGDDTKRARKLLTSKVVEGVTALEWINQNYSLDRLFCLYEFSVYCEWLDVGEIIRHFGDFLRVFITLEGQRPSWCSGPFHLVLKVGYSELWRQYRTYVICEWLKVHWNEAYSHFENNIGVLDSLPKLRDLEYSQVFTQYKKMRMNRKGDKGK